MLQRDSDRAYGQRDRVFGMGGLQIFPEAEAEFFPVHLAHGRMNRGVADDGKLSTPKIDIEQDPISMGSLFHAKLVKEFLGAAIRIFFKPAFGEMHPDLPGGALFGLPDGADDGRLTITSCHLRLRPRMSRRRR